MSLYEDGGCTLLAFMQDLEEIVKFIDNFTCGSIILDVVYGSFTPSISLPRTVSTKSIFPPTLQESSQSYDHHSPYFLITRKNGSFEKDIRITLSLNHVDLGKDVRVIDCSYSTAEKQQIILDKGALRDSICRELAPSMEIFPCMSRLLMNSLDMKPTPLTKLEISGILPRLGMQLEKGETKSIFIFLDDADKIVTIKKYESEKEEKLYWDNDLFQASTYIIGNLLINLPD